jgi:hypothetical protein
VWLGLIIVKQIWKKGIHIIGSRKAYGEWSAELKNLKANKIRLLQVVNDNKY